MVRSYVLLDENERLKKELHASNVRIVKLVQQLEELQAKHIQQDGLPFVEDVKEALKEDFHFYVDGVKTSMATNFKLIVNKEEKPFTGRFMPNVRINLDKDIFNNRVFEKFYVKNKSCFNHYLSPMLDFCITSPDGSIIMTVPKEFYDVQSHIKEVSFFEAIPELVPYGMVYDKEIDSLVKKVCVNQMC